MSCVPGKATQTAVGRPCLTNTVPGGGDERYAQLRAEGMAIGSVAGLRVRG